MSQKYQPGSQGVQQSQTPVQSGQQQYQPAHFDEALSSEFRATLEDLSWLRKQAKWGAEQAHVRFQGSGIETTLEAISEIAELNVELILSNSKYVPYHVDTFRQVASDAIQELQQFQQEPFVEAIVTDLARAVNSAEELLATYQGPNQQGGVQPQHAQQTQPQIGTGSQQYSQSPY